MDNYLVKVSKTSFLKKNIIFVIIAAILCILAKESSKPLLISAIVVIVLAMTISSFDNKFCWSIFLVPNIRLFDALESTFIVNILFVVPLIFYLFRLRDFNKVFPVVGAGILFIIEYIHKIIFVSPIINLAGWVLAFIWCCYALLDEKCNINKSDVTYALATGVIFSGVVFLLNNPEFASDLVNNVLVGHRLEAYASDPNAYSTYLCIALSAIVIKSELKLTDYVFIAILIVLGFLTTSKMCLLLIAVNLLFLIIGTTTHVNKLLRNTLIFIVLCFFAYIFRDLIGMFIDNFFKRAGGSNWNMNTLTSGRFNIQKEYIEALQTNIPLLLFGNGFIYFRTFITPSFRQAHNTYLDILLSWGIVGTIIFLLVIAVWIELYKKKNAVRSYTLKSKFPTMILLLCFSSLSLFSAGMFFFMIAFCMLQLEPKKYANTEKDK